jgi:hypothetical protein
VTLLHGHRKIFPKQTRSLSLIELYLFRKNRTIRFMKTFGFCGFNLWFESSLYLLLDAPAPFSMSQTYLNFRFPHVISFLDSHSKTVKTRTSGMQNPTVRFSQTCQIWSSIHGMPMDLSLKVNNSCIYVFHNVI